jgi:hypothetical protein
MSLFTALLLALLPAATIQGVVRTEGSQVPIPGAVVQLPELRRSVAADERGIFIIPNVPAGSWRVRITAVGYEALEVGVDVPPSGAVRLDLELAARPVPLAPVEVQAQAGRGGQTEALRSVGPGAIRLSGDALRAVPMAAEPDIIRAIQSLPSVAAASDFSSALYVRGGSPDQNLITLDGVPIFNPYHLGGLFGAVDPDVVQSAGVMAGAFAADTGDRLSSVIDIRTRDGGRDRTRGFGAVGLVSSRAGVDGPLPGGRGSYLVSARRTYLDLFTRGAQAAGLIPFSLPYRFTDAQMKAVYDVGPLGRLSATAYINDETLVLRPRREEGINQNLDFDWGSRAVGVRYWQPWGSSLTVEAEAAWSEFSGQFDAGEYRWDNERQRYGTELVPLLGAGTATRNALLAAGATAYRGRHQLRAGVQADWYRFHYGVDHNEDLEGFLPRFDLTTTPRTVSAYLEDQWSPGEAFSVRAGMRVMAAGSRGSAVMPRLGMRYAPHPGWAFTLGAGRSAQVMHSLHDQEAIAASVIAYDQMAAVPEEMGLTRADDVVLGAQWTGSRLDVRVEAYEKRFHRLPVSRLPDDPLESLVVIPEGFGEGRGSARGVEVFARYTRGESALSAAYALARAEREIDGVRFTPRFERRHTLDVNGHTSWGSRGQLTARVVVATGQPYTPVVGATQRFRYDPAQGSFTYQFSGPEVVLGDHNAARLPGYFRLDFGARRSYERRLFGQAGTLSPYFSVLNVLNTPNVLFAEPQGGGYHAQSRLVYAPQMPIFPTLGVEWKF